VNFGIQSFAACIKILLTVRSKRPKARSKNRWEKKYKENDIRKLGNVKWRQEAQDGDGWRRETRQALTLLKQ
jgi:hypothetical protein